VLSQNTNVWDGVGAVIQQCCLRHSCRMELSWGTGFCDSRACQTLIVTTNMCSQLSGHALASELTKQGANDQAAIPDLLPVLRLTSAVQI